MEYGETSSHNIAADLLYAAIHIEAISLYKTPEHAFFLAVGFSLIKFRASVRQPSLNLYTELCVYEFAKFNNFCGNVALMLDKTYEYDFRGTIRHYKEVIGAVSNGRRH
jgi:hypothetical protein